MFAFATIFARDINFVFCNFTFRCRFGTNRMSLSGRTAVVTGATKGIGQGIARALAEQKCHLILTARTATGPNSLQQLADKITELGATCETYQVDHTNDTQIQQFFVNLHTSLSEHNRTLDIFVNNAFSSVGFLTDTVNIPLWEKRISEKTDYPGDVWDAVNNVGLRNVYICSIFATRIMHGQKHGGIIVNMTSIGGMMSLFDAAYGIGKEAINRLTAEFALRTPPHIKVFALSPGMAKTESMDSVFEMAKKDIGGNPSEAALNFVKENAETPLFIGRVLATAVGNNKFVEKVNGKIVASAEAADELEVFDENGKRPLSSRSIKFMLCASFPEYQNGFVIRNFPRQVVLPWFLMQKASAVKYW